MLRKVRTENGWVKGAFLPLIRVSLSSRAFPLPSRLVNYAGTHRCLPMTGMARLNVTSSLNGNAVFDKSRSKRFIWPRMACGPVRCDERYLSSPVPAGGVDEDVSVWYMVVGGPSALSRQMGLAWRHSHSACVSSHIWYLPYTCLNVLRFSVCEITAEGRISGAELDCE